MGGGLRAMEDIVGQCALYLLDKPAFRTLPQILDGSISVLSQCLVVDSERLVARGGHHSRLLPFPGHTHDDGFDVPGHLRRSREKNPRGCAPVLNAGAPSHEHTSRILGRQGPRGKTKS